MSRLRQQRADDESGMTLIEVTMAMAVSMILALGLSGVIATFGKAEASTVASANAASTTRLVLLQFQHDVQSANPVDVLAQPSTYNDELQVTIQPSNQVVTWLYTPSPDPVKKPYGGVLTRQLGNATPMVELTGVSNSATQPVFAYYDHCFLNLVNQPQVSSANIASAVTVVQISVAVEGLSTAPYDTTTSVSILNRPPTPSPC